MLLTRRWMLPATQLMRPLALPLVLPTLLLVPLATQLTRLLVRPRTLPLVPSTLLRTLPRTRCNRGLRLQIGGCTGNGAAPFLLSERFMRCFAILASALALALSGCGSPNDPGVGGVTKAEAEQLNEAAEELNQDAPPPSLAQPQKSN